MTCHYYLMALEFYVNCIDRDNRHRRIPSSCNKHNWNTKLNFFFFLFFQGTLRNGNYSPYSNGHTPNNGHGTFNSSGFSESLGDISLVHSPPVTPEVKNSQLHPKSLVERYVDGSSLIGKNFVKLIYSCISLS